MNKFTPNTPGSFDMPFADYKAAPGVNKSLLDKFRICPLLAYEQMHGLCEDEPTKAMLTGSLVDDAIFNPRGVNYYLQPEKYTNDKGESLDWANGAKVCKAWNAAHDDKEIISRKKEQEIKRMVDAVWSDKFASKLLTGCQYQKSLFAVHDKTGLLRKGRPDAIGDDYMVDLKKVRDASTEALSKAIERYSYYVQAAYYLDLATSLDMDINDFFFIAVEESSRPKVNVRRLKLSAIALGRWVYQRDLSGYAECLKSGEWHGYSGSGPEPDEIDVPGYTEARIKGGIEAIELTIGGETYAP